MVREEQSDKDTEEIGDGVCNSCREIIFGLILIPTEGNQENQCDELQEVRHLLIIILEIWIQV